MKHWYKPGFRAVLDLDDCFVSFQMYIKQHVLASSFRPYFSDTFVLTQLSPALATLQRYGLDRLFSMQILAPRMHHRFSERETNKTSEPFRQR